MAASRRCAGARNREGEATLGDRGQDRDGDPRDRAAFDRRCGKQLRKERARTFKAGQQCSDIPGTGGCCAPDHNNLAGFPARRGPHVLLGNLGKLDAECRLTTLRLRPRLPCRERRWQSGRPTGPHLFQKIQRISPGFFPENASTISPMSDATASFYAVSCLSGTG